LDIKEIINWLVGTVIVGIVLIITNIISIIRAGKMMPKELKGADLLNKQTEIDITAKMDTMLGNSIAKALDWQKRFDELDDRFRIQEEELESQKNRIIVLECLSETQKKEINVLTAEVNNYSLWTNALVEQLQKVDLKPIRMEDVDGIDLSVIRSKRNFE